MSTTHQDMVKFIKRNVNDISIEERKEILQIIINSSTDDSKIHTKGDGTVVSFKDLDQATVSAIYNFIQLKIANKTLYFQDFPESVSETN